MPTRRYRPPRAFRGRRIPICPTSSGLSMHESSEPPTPIMWQASARPLPALFKGRRKRVQYLCRSGARGLSRNVARNKRGTRYRQRLGPATTCRLPQHRQSFAQANNTKTASIEEVNTPASARRGTFRRWPPRPQPRTATQTRPARPAQRMQAAGRRWRSRPARWAGLSAAHTDAMHSNQARREPGN